MPYRRKASSFRRSLALRPVDSNKNVAEIQNSIGVAIQNETLAIAKDSASNTTANEVERGCAIKAIWLSFDVCGLDASGVLQKTGLYLMKNPGANLTAPGVFSVGTSNEKKFIFKQWQFMTMRNQDGNPPFHWEGWIKIPKRYSRMGADDLIHLTHGCSQAVGHITGHAIYKWYK